LIGSTCTRRIVAARWDSPAGSAASASVGELELSTIRLFFDQPLRIWGTELGHLSASSVRDMLRPTDLLEASCGEQRSVLLDVCVDSLRCESSSVSGNVASARSEQLAAAEAAARALASTAHSNSLTVLVAGPAASEFECRLRVKPSAWWQLANANQEV
jgi:hypothetical protein